MGSKYSKRTKLLTALVVVIAIVATLTIMVGANTVSKKFVAVGAADTLLPTGVNQTLQVSFADVNYLTQSPQMSWGQGNYGKASYTVGTGATVFNDTYQVFYQKTSTAMAFSQMNFNYSKDAGKNVSYFYTQTRIAYNGTSDIYFGTSASVLSAVPAATQSTSQGRNTTYVEIVNGVPTLYYYNVTGVEESLSFTAQHGFSGTMTALNFYELSLYVTGSSLSSELQYTTNGTIAAKASVNVNHTASQKGADLGYKVLNNTFYQVTSSAQYSGMIVDWGYIVNHNSNTNLASPGITMATPDSQVLGPIASAASDVSVQISSSGNAPFDPSAINSTYAQVANSSLSHVNTNIKGGDFSSIVGQNNTTLLQSVGLNDSNAFANITYSNGTIKAMNSSSGFQTFATLSPQNSLQNANIHVAVWNSTGIKNAIMNYLKNYTANQATLSTSVSTSYKDMTIIGYTIDKVDISTNLSSGDASALKNYFDNGIAAAMKLDNMSLVNQNTSAIVAGAFAGDFYYSGMALVPIIQGNSIVNPVTGQTFSSVEAAGFAAGSFISGGAVVVPELSLVSFSAGSPVFAASGSVFGSLFGSLTTAGQSVSNYLVNGASSISGAIGSVKTVATQYVVKPITSTATNASKQASTSFTSFKDGIANITNAVIPQAGVVSKDISTDVSGALGPIAGSISSTGTQLGSMKQSLTTAVGAGYSGIKTGVYDISTYVQNGYNTTVNKVWNTAGKLTNDSSAVLSTTFTSVKNLPGFFANGSRSIASAMYNGTVVKAGQIAATIGADLNSAGNYIAAGALGDLNSTQNVFGAIGSRIVGAGNALVSGAQSAFSSVVAFGSAVGHVLEIVLITIGIVAIVGVILYIALNRRRGLMVPGETDI